MFEIRYKISTIQIDFKSFTTKQKIYLIRHLQMKDKIFSIELIADRLNVWVFGINRTKLENQ